MNSRASANARASAGPIRGLSNSECAGCGCSMSRKPSVTKEGVDEIAMMVRDLTQHVLEIKHSSMRNLGERMDEQERMIRSLIHDGFRQSGPSPDGDGPKTPSDEVVLLQPKPTKRISAKFLENGQPDSAVRFPKQRVADIVFTPTTNELINHSEGESSTPYDAQEKGDLKPANYVPEERLAQLLNPWSFELPLMPRGVIHPDFR